MLIACLGLPALVAAGSVAGAVVHWVSPDGPLSTIQQGIDAAGKGDAVVVAAGRYAEEVVIRTSGITLRAADGARPLIDGEDAREYGIRLSDEAPVSDVTIEGFEIANLTRTGIDVPHRDSTNVIIRDNVIHHSVLRGVNVCGARHLIEGNTVYMIRQDQEAMGIHLSHAEDCLVRDNDVFLCKKTAIRCQTGKRNRIESNLMHECWNGLDLNASSGALVYNNYVYDNCEGTNPKHVKGHSGWNRIWHNTFYGNHGPHIDIAVNEASDYEGPGPDLDYLDIRNNILVKCGATHIWNRPQIVGDNLIIGHNLYHGPEGWPPFFYHTEWPRSGRPGLTTLDEVRAQTPFGEGGRVVDPELIDPERGNLDYPDTSPAAAGDADLDSPYGNQMGARGLRTPATRFVRVGLKAVAASTNEDRMHLTTDGRYCTD